MHRQDLPVGQRATSCTPDYAHYSQTRKRIPHLHAGRVLGPLPLCFAAGEERILRACRHQRNSKQSSSYHCKTGARCSSMLFLRAADSFWVRSSQFWCSAAARLRAATESGSKRPSAQLEYSAFKAFEKACSKRRTPCNVTHVLLTRTCAASSVSLPSQWRRSGIRGESSGNLLNVGEDALLSMARVQAMQHWELTLPGSLARVAQIA